MDLHPTLWAFHALAPSVFGDREDGPAVQIRANQAKSHGNDRAPLEFSVPFMYRPADTAGLSKNQDNRMSRNKAPRAGPTTDRSTRTPASACPWEKAVDSPTPTGLIDQSQALVSFGLK